MVRIIRHSENDSREKEATLGLLAIVAADDPGQLKKLLAEFGVSGSDDPQQLISQVLENLDRKGKAFQMELTGLLSDRLSDLAVKRGHKQEDTYIDAIAGAVGAIANTVGSLTGKKQKQREASQQAFTALMAYKAQQAQNVANTAAYTDAQGQRAFWLKTVGILALVGLAGWGFFQWQKKQALIQNS